MFNPPESIDGLPNEEKEEQKKMDELPATVWVEKLPVGVGDLPGLGGWTSFCDSRCSQACFAPIKLACAGDGPVWNAACSLPHLC